MTRRPDSIPQVADVRRFAGSAADRDRVADLLIEVPHGATRPEDFDDLAGALNGPFPEGLREYFFVNTDVGAPEVAERLAQRLVASDAARVVWVIRSRVPRTFVDCNRAIEGTTVPSSSAKGAMTPGIASYVTDPDDVRALLARHAAYVDVVMPAYEAVCGGGGRALMLHSYAPKEVDVEVDERIVERLRDAYRPEVYERWRWRPEVDLVTKTPDGVRLADDRLVERTLGAFRAAGVAAGADATYALHPSTMGHRFASRFPGRTLCLEMRRDLLACAFVPFARMEIDPSKADRMAAALEAAFAGPR